SSASTRWTCASTRTSRPPPDDFCGIWQLPSDGARDFDAREALDLVADTHVLVVLHTDAAFGPGAHLVHVVLEATQRFQRPLEDHHVVAQHPDRVVALDRTLDDQAAGDHAELAGTEHLAHLRHTDDLLLD